MSLPIDRTCERTFVPQSFLSSVYLLYRVWHWSRRRLRPGLLSFNVNYFRLGTLNVTTRTSPRTQKSYVYNSFGMSFGHLIIEGTFSGSEKRWKMTQDETTKKDGRGEHKIKRWVKRVK